MCMQIGACPYEVRGELMLLKVSSIMKLYT